MTRPVHDRRYAAVLAALCRYRRLSEPAGMLDCLELSGADMVTMSIRRISLDGYAESLVDLLGGRYPAAAEYRRLRHRARRDPDRRIGARGARHRLGQARADRRPRDCSTPMSSSSCTPPDELVRERVRRAPLLQRGPGRLPQARRCRLLAAVMPLGLADRLGRGIANPAAIELICAPQPGPGRARRRHRHRFRRGAGDGTWLRRGAGRYRDRQIARSAAHGGGDAAPASKAGASPGSPAASPSAASPSRRARNWAWSAPEAWVGPRARPTPPDIAMPPGRVAERFNAPVLKTHPAGAVRCRRAPLEESILSQYFGWRRVIGFGREPRGPAAISAANRPLVEGPRRGMPATSASLGRGPAAAGVLSACRCRRGDRVPGGLVPAWFRPGHIRQASAGSKAR